jgi:hypothetical protein
MFAAAPTALVLAPILDTMAADRLASSIADEGE